jgi:hypothetical protein
MMLVVVVSVHGDACCSCRAVVARLIEQDHLRVQLLCASAHLLCASAVATSYVVAADIGAQKLKHIVKFRSKGRGLDNMQVQGDLDDHTHWNQGIRKALEKLSS